MLKLAVFNSIKYSFNMKTWVSDRAKVQYSPDNFKGDLGDSGRRNLISKSVFSMIAWVISN